MFKKLISSLAIGFLATSSALACWFTQENFNSAYLAGVNYYVSHYDGKAVDLNSATYYNNQSVNLPLTVWCKVSPRIMSVNGQIQESNIRSIKLFYKILPGNNNDTTAKWRLAKAIDMGPTPKWNLNFASPVKLFGNNVITKALIEKNGDTISAGDGILLAFYFTDNSANAIANAEEITPGEAEPLVFPTNEDVASNLNTSNYPNSSDYKPAYVMRVIYNGKNVNIGR